MHITTMGNKDTWKYNPLHLLFKSAAIYSVDSHKQLL